MSNTEVTSKNVGEVSKKLEAAIASALDQAGLGHYQIETLTLATKQNPAMAGLLPGCELKCEIGGFPPKLKCEVKCG